MRKGIKYALFFTGGVAVGIGVCGANLISYALTDEDIREGVKTKISKKIDKALFGEKAERSKTGYVSYRNIYRERKEPAYVNCIDNIIFETHSEAERVIEQMNDAVNKYGVVTVGDVYDFANVASFYTDSKYGWTDIRSAEIFRVRDGFYIKLPRPHLL